VILDVLSRCVPDWMVAGHESAILAERLIAQTADKEGITPRRLTILSDTRAGVSHGARQAPRRV
jgi:transposase InsO family protein